MGENVAAVAGQGELDPGVAVCIAAGAWGVVGDEVAQGELFVADEVVGLLVTRGRIPVAEIKVRREQRPALVEPCLIVGAGELPARGPGATCFRCRLRDLIIFMVFGCRP